MLPQSQRVGNSDFLEISKIKPDFIQYFTQFLVKYYKNPLFKATVVISKSVLKTSSKRNLIKRRLRALIREHKNELRPGFYVFIVRGNINFEDLTYEKLGTSFDSFLSKNH